MDDINLVIIPRYRQSIQGSLTYRRYAKNFDEFIRQLSLSSFVNKESAMASTSIKTIVELCNNFARVWTSNDESTKMERLKEIYKQAIERIELLRHQMLSISNVLKDEYFNCLARRI
ncbi:hypothetical protein RF11_11727 [Thelohanellus kitauei]|uniref:Uncharacterized protein n=1 Tax=Thelohanellus kitauei TaxID=669202 RepID=A0A0C2N5Q1_THEKT|nr:hypothetical protein RF11_11727 [Thelohanellus kitauei]